MVPLAANAEILKIPLFTQYAQPVTKKGTKKETAEATEEKKLSNHAQRHLEEKRKGASRFRYDETRSA